MPAPCRRLLAIVVAALWFGLPFAATAQEVPRPPAPIPAPAPGAAVPAVPPLSCNDPIPATKVSSGIMAVSALKSWQPRGGEFTFTVTTPTPLPANAAIVVCYGWKWSGGQATDFRKSDSTRIVDIKLDKNTITIGAVVPRLDGAPQRFNWPMGEEKRKPHGIFTGFFIVPVADVRILIRDPATNANVVDLTTSVGISHVGIGFALAVICVLIGFGILWGMSRRRQPALAGINPLLRVITTERNYASLSQAQIMLWTFVVGASAIYVMSLSGELIDITTSTLVLLGISGVVVVASKAKSTSDDPPDPAPVPAPVAGAPAVAAAAAAAPPRDRPYWSDLIMDVKQDASGNWTSTIEVARVQMLFFTLITATFALLKVVTSYEIPDIPQGFLILMGISNGVYMGAKLTD